MRDLLMRKSRLAGWALCVALTGAFLVNCVPVAAAEQACECCTKDGLQAVSNFTVAKEITVSAPSPLPVADLPSVEPPTFDAWAHHALHDRSWFTPPGVPRYLLASSLLI